MELVLNGQAYSVQAEGGTLTSSIEGMLPLTLKLSRSADLEYYSSLPQTASVDGAEVTSYVKAAAFLYSIIESGNLPMHILIGKKCCEDVREFLENFDVTIDITSKRCYISVIR